MCSNEFDSFMCTTIVNDFCNDLFDAAVFLDKQRQHFNFVRHGDHFLIGLKNNEDDESNNSDAKDNIKSSSIRSKATSTIKSLL